MKPLFFCIAVLFLLCYFSMARAQMSDTKFKVIAFYTAKNDRAHISFVHEANRWFPTIAKQYHFAYDSTSDWNNLNEKFLDDYQVVIFLDTRPELHQQREA